jgi:hypothetical protein
LRLPKKTINFAEAEARSLVSAPSANTTPLFSQLKPFHIYNMADRLTQLQDCLDDVSNTATQHATIH